MQVTSIEPRPAPPPHGNHPVGDAAALDLGERSSETVGMRLPFIAALLLVPIAACGSSASTTGAGTDSATPSSASSPAPSSGSSDQAPSASASSAPASGAPWDTLTKDALACPLVDHGFQHCPAFDALRTSKDPFWSSYEGDVAILDALASTDEKQQILATSRPGHDPAKALTDKARATRLFDLIEKPGNPYGVRVAAVRWLAYADFDALGLVDRLKALATNPDKAIRQSVALDILSKKDPPEKGPAVDLVTTLLGDDDADVDGAASVGLANAARDGAATCAALQSAVDRADAKTDHVIVGASSTSRCKGLHSKILAYVDKKTIDPSKIRKGTGRDNALAVELVCEGQDVSKDEKAKGFAIGLRMADPRDPDPTGRSRALSVFPQCDYNKAKATLQTFTKDKDAAVAMEARAVLDKIKAAEAKAKAGK